MPKITVQAFSKRLAHIRNSKGLSQIDLAKLTGISPRMIAYYETRIKDLPPAKVILLAKALNVSIDELMGYKAVKDKKSIARNVFKRAKMLDELPRDAQKTVFNLIDVLHGKK